MPTEPTSAAVIFGANVERLRLKKELTQEQLGWACGLHQTAIARIEEGKREPRFGTIVKVAEGLEVPPADLFAGIR